MNKNQRELRRTAARKFKQSLEQLEGMLQPDPPSQENRNKATQPASELDSSIPAEETAHDSLSSEQGVDQIVEDIERYIEANKPK